MGAILRWLRLCGLAGVLATGCASARGTDQAVRLPADSPGFTDGKALHAVLRTSEGTIVMRLLPQAAPKTVENFVALATGKKTWTDPKTRQPTRRPFYNGTLFHRVVPSFMIQGGAPRKDGAGGPGYTFDDEIAPTHPFDRAWLAAMANAGLNTNGSQFFITVTPAPWLTGKHTVFGEVVEGREVAEAISRVPRSPDSRGRPLKPVVLQEVRIEYR